MKQFFSKLFIFVALLFIPLYALEKYYDAYFTKNLDACNKPLWVLKQKDNSYDFAALGSSRVFNMLDIITIEKTTQNSGINIAASGTGFAENYLLLKQFTKNNSIKNLVVEVDIYSLGSKNGFGYPFHDYLYLNLLNQAAVDSIYKDNVDIKKYYLWKYFPFAKYMEFSNFYSIYKVLRGGYECTTSFLDTTKGSFLVDNIEFDTKEGEIDRNKTFKKRYIDEKDYAYLIKIIAFAKSKNMNVILYTAPEYFESTALQGNRSFIFSEIKKLAVKEKVQYYNFSEATIPICRNKELFKDNSHLNKKGSLLFSKQFGDSLNTILN